MAEGWQLSRRARVSEGEVAYEVMGEGPAVVLVHGTPSWSYLWRNVATALAKNFTVYVFDLPGYGDSEKREGQDLSIAAQGRALTELLESWRLESPAIAGHDIGGAIVLRTHLLDEVPFSRISLIDAVAVNPWVTATTTHVQNHMDAYRTMPTHIYEEVVAAHLHTAVHRNMDESAFEAYTGQWRGEEGQAAYLRKQGRSIRRGGCRRALPAAGLDTDSGADHMGGAG
jgi:pimeloyl-ACP methyl ester carboxylesterase